MKYQSKTFPQKFCLLAGVGLLIAAAVVLIAWQWSIRAAAQQAQDYVQTLRQLIPAPQGAVLEPRSDNRMSALALEGTDFLGILEMPQHGAALPVGADWGQSSKYPCRFSGSIYDGSMEIGTTSQAGQFDFYENISVGDKLLFTDMAGNRYAYAVTNVRYVQHADQSALQRDDAALTVFIKNVFSLEYIILSCDIP